MRQLILFVIGLLCIGVAAQAQVIAPRVLIVVAHPDDEYMSAGTTYRLAMELGAQVDQVVITNGEGGYKYSLLGEKIYGLELTREEIGRAHLPRIRKEEVKNAGKILGVRKHVFYDQQDLRYTKDVNEALGMWQVNDVRSSLKQLLIEGSYDFVFALLPTVETHGHHKAATLLALEAVAELPVESRPVILGVAARTEAETGAMDDPVDARGFVELEGHQLTRISPDAPVFTFDRATSFGFKDKLNYQMVVSWMISEHKSQGAFQALHGRHRFEDFRFFAINECVGALTRTRALFDSIQQRK